MELEETVGHLNAELNDKEEKIDQLNVELGESKLEICRLQEIIAVKNLYAYSKHSQSLDSNSEQLSLFSINAEDEPEEVKFNEEEETVEVIAHHRNRTKKSSHTDYSHLPRKVITHGQDEKVYCDACGNEMHVYKYEETEELVYVPAQAYILVHRVPYYECTTCINEDGGTLHTHVDTWKPLISKSKASSSLVSALIDYKYNLGLPYYAIEQRFEEDGLDISRANMTNWMMKIMKYIDPLYERMHQDLLGKPIIAADETTIHVLKEEGRESKSISYLWQYKTCNDENEISLFEYQPTRSGDVPQKTLKGYQGIILSDKYAGYSKVGAKRAFCHAHAYRYIRESLEILPKKARRGSLEEEAVKRYQKVFEADRKIHDKALKK